MGVLENKMAIALVAKFSKWYTQWNTGSESYYFHHGAERLLDEIKDISETCHPFLKIEELGTDPVRAKYFARQMNDMPCVSRIVQDFSSKKTRNGSLDDYIDLGFADQQLIFDTWFMFLRYFDYIITAEVVFKTIANQFREYCQENSTYEELFTKGSYYTLAANVSYDNNSIVNYSEDRNFSFAYAAVFAYKRQEFLRIWCRPINLDVFCYNTSASDPFKGLDISIVVHTSIDTGAGFNGKSPEEIYNEILVGTPGQAIHSVFQMIEQSGGEILNQ